MAGETYRYNVIIGVDVQTSGVSSGTRDVEQQMSRTERKAKETVEKIQKTVDKLGPTFNKALSGVDKTTQGTVQKVSEVAIAVEAANFKIVQSTNTRVTKQIDAERRYDAELQKLGLKRVSNTMTGRLYLKGGASSSLNSAEAQIARAHAQERARQSTQSARSLPADFNYKALASGAEEAATATEGLSLGLGSVALAAGATVVAIVAVVAIAAVLAYGFVKLTEKLYDATKAYTEYAASIGRGAEETGLAVETVAALTNEADRFGITFQQVAGITDTFRDKIGQAMAGVGDARDSIKLLGLDAKTAGSNVDASFRQAIAAIVKAPPGMKQAQLAFAAFGDEGYKLIPFFRSFNGNVDEAVRSADRLGIMLSGKDTAAAREFNKHFSDLKKVINGLVYTFGREFMPVLEKVLVDFTKWIVQNRGEIKTWAQLAVNAVASVIKVFKELVQFTKDHPIITRIIAPGAVDAAAITTAVLNQQPGASPQQGPTYFDYSRPKPGQAAPVDPAVLEAQRKALEERAKQDLDAAIQLEELKLTEANTLLQQKITEAQDILSMKNDLPGFGKAMSSAVDAYTKAWRPAFMDMASKTLQKAQKEGMTEPQVKAIKEGLDQRFNEMVNRGKEVAREANKSTQAELKKYDEMRVQDIQAQGQREVALQQVNDQRRLEDLQNALDAGIKTEKQYLNESYQIQLEAFQQQRDNVRKMITEIDRQISTKGDPTGALKRQREELQGQYDVLNAQAVNLTHTQDNKLVPSAERLRSSYRLLNKTLVNLSDDTETYRRRQQMVTDEATNLAERIADVYDHMATRGVNQAERYKLAWVEAISAIGDASEEADISIIRSNVRMNDSLVYHSNQAKALIFEHLAQQKSRSQQVADSIIEIYDYATDKISAALDKIGIGKIPGLGSAVKGLFQNWLTGFTRNMIDKIMPGMGDTFDRAQNPMLAEAKDQTRLLRQIAVNTGGGAGVLGLPGIFTGGRGSATRSSGGLFGISGGGYGGTAGYNPGYYTSGGGGGGGVIQPEYGGIGNPNMVHDIIFGGGGGQASSTQQGLHQAFSWGNLNKSLFGSKGFGWNSGTMQGIGALSSIAGGMIGGNVGSVLSGVGGGIGMAATLSTMLGIGALGGPLGLAIAGAIGGAVALGSILFGRNKTRRREEQQRTAILLNAKDQLTKLLKGVNSDKIDGDSAVEQAGQIRQDYLSQVGQLTDRKTRDIAIATVRELDAIITQIQQAAVAQRARKERVELLVPTFADGGTTSSFMRGRGLGYVTGPGGPREDRVIARLSAGEYVLDADTTRAIGIANLDRLRRTKGRDVAPILQAADHNAGWMMADGGYLSSAAPTAAPSPTGGSALPRLYITNNVYQGPGGVQVQTEAWFDTPEGKQKIVDVVEENIFRDGPTGKIPSALRRNVR